VEGLVTTSLLAADSATAEQAAVIGRAADTRTLLVAPAGTGKTFTLTRRIEHLLGQGLAADEILLLSFSRAAVAELAKRTRSSGGRGRFVRAATFDAWALALLQDLYPTEDWHQASFAERIREATGAITDGDTDEYTSSVRHVLLDEVQDLVGDRKAMVEALLGSLDCGFTVVGDPAQAIYDFQACAEEDRRDFFSWIRANHTDDLVESALTHDFRARTPRSPGLLECGAALRGTVVPAGIRDRVGEEFRNVLDAGTIDDVVGGFAYQEGTSVILCRDNGQALEVSASLWRAGIDHRLRRRAEDGGSPRWLVPLLGRSTGLNLGLELFLQATGLEADHAAEVWAELRAVVGGSADRLPVDRLRSALAAGRLTRLPTPPAGSRVTVSSMHGAKGLEFDRVFVVESRQHADEDPESEARVLYVAMTRGRDDLFRLQPLPHRGAIRAKRYEDAGRWVRFDLRKRWSRPGMALESGDVFRQLPAGTTGFVADPVELQMYLESEVRPGDAVTLTRTTLRPDDESPAPLYTVDHRGRPIGVVSPSFRHALTRTVHGRRAPAEDARWPTAITDCWIDDVEAVAGSVANGRRAGLGEHGVWLVPRLNGLSWFRWREAETGDE
jgi:hypothetical protein